MLNTITRKDLEDLIKNQQKFQEGKTPDTERAMFKLEDVKALIEKGEALRKTLAISKDNELDICITFIRRTKDDPKFQEYEKAQGDEYTQLIPIVLLCKHTKFDHSRVCQYFKYPWDDDETWYIETYGESTGLIPPRPKLADDKAHP